MQSVFDVLPDTLSLEQAVNHVVTGEAKIQSKEDVEDPIDFFKLLP